MVASVEATRPPARGIASDLTRDEGWAPIVAAGLRPVTQIAIDAIWSAVRWRPVELVKSKNAG